MKNIVKEQPFKIELQLFASDDNSGLEGLKTLSAEFKSVSTELKGLLDTQTAEIKKYGETTTETAKSIGEMEGKIKSISDEIKEIQGRADELEKKMGRPGYGGEGETKSLGEQFTESDAYKNMIANNDVKSAAYNIKSFFTKDLSSAAGSAGALVVPQRYGEIIAPPNRNLRIRDLMTVQSTSSNAIEYVEETGFTNNAAPVAEKNQKPQSNLTFELKTEAVKTIAHWIPATRQIIADASQLQAYVNNRLVYGLKLKEEQQILYGNGTSPNLQGILTNDRVQTYDWSAGQAGDKKIDAIRRAITLAMIAEYPVDGVIVHPKDWEDIELAKGNDGHYIWVTVPNGGQKQLWLAPVVVTTAINQGEAAVGAFGMGAFLWDREQANVRVADQHAEYFTANMIAILAEERLALTNFRPESFIHITFDNAPAGS